MSFDDLLLFDRKYLWIFVINEWRKGYVKVLPGFSWDVNGDPVDAQCIQISGNVPGFKFKTDTMWGDKDVLKWELAAKKPQNLKSKIIN